MPLSRAVTGLSLKFVAISNVLFCSIGRFVALSRVNRFLTAKLREYALRLRGMAEKDATPGDLDKEKAGMMGEVFKVRRRNRVLPE